MVFFLCFWLVLKFERATFRISNAEFLLVDFCIFFFHLLSFSPISCNLAYSPEFLSMFEYPSCKTFPLHLTPMCFGRFFSAMRLCAAFGFSDPLCPPPKRSPEGCAKDRRRIRPEGDFVKEKQAQYLNGLHLRVIIHEQDFFLRRIGFYGREIIDWFLMTFFLETFNFSEKISSWIRHYIELYSLIIDWIFRFGYSSRISSEFV